jgi:hypothetical protein
MSRTTPDRLADVQVRRKGTLAGFEPLSQAARTWISEHLPDNGPQFGHVTYIEIRCADQVIDDMIRGGLIVQWLSC